jgi:DNA (cytosine-5)-methyltransferase 1
MWYNKPAVVDLFCGAGGLSEGFTQAGFEVISALDYDPVALSTFSRNHPGTHVICGDIRNVASADLARGRRVDVLIGGPSCQGFSTHGKRIAEDPRNFLFREFVRVARDLRPSWVVIENVKGLLWYDKGAFRKRIHDAFEELGYQIASRVLMGADFGVPQRRERLVFIGTLTDRQIKWPNPTHGPEAFVPHRSVWDAISDLPLLGLGGGQREMGYPRLPLTEYQEEMRTGSQVLTFQEARPLSADALAIVCRIPQGEGIRFLTEEELPERFRRMRQISNGRLRRDCTTLYHRLAWDKPSYTITCYFRNVSSGPFVHPEDHRALSYREAARLQSFRDSYEFDPRCLARQIGNAVPPLLGKAIASSIQASMSGSTDLSHGVATHQGTLAGLIV